MVSLIAAEYDEESEQVLDVHTPSKCSTMDFEESDCCETFLNSYCTDYYILSMNTDAPPCERGIEDKF